MSSPPTSKEESCHSHSLVAEGTDLKEILCIKSISKSSWCHHKQATVKRLEGGMPSINFLRKTLKKCIDAVWFVIASKSYTKTQNYGVLSITQCLKRWKPNSLTTIIKLKNLLYIHKHSGFTFNYLSRKARFSARFITITDQEFKQLNFTDKSMGYS